MLMAPFGEFDSYVNSATNGSAGATVTPGNDTYGSYASVLAGGSVPDDVYGLWVCINTMSVSGSVRDAIAKLGVDPAGGTAFVDVISHLPASCASGFAANGVGIWSYWPLFFKSGTSFGVAASVHNATVGTCGAIIQLSCRPAGDRPPRVGSFVRTFGATTASSSGTAFTPGNGTKSAYTKLGTTAATDELWYLNGGVGIANATMNNNPLTVDFAIGPSGSQRDRVSNMYANTSTSETLSFIASGAMAHMPPSTDIWVRAGSNGASVSGVSAIAYGVGG